MADSDAAQPSEAAPAEFAQDALDAAPTLAPRDASALGSETVHQDLALCDNLDVVQNMFLGREKTKHFALQEEEMEKSAGTTLGSLAVSTIRSVRQRV